MKNIYIIVSFCLFSCNSVRQKEENPSFILSLPKEDLECLEYITIGIRGNEKPAKFLYSTKYEDLLLPIVSDSDDSAYKYYGANVMKFCLNNNVTCDCKSFLISFSARIARIFETANVRMIQSNQKIGSFITFTFRNNDELIYRFDTNVCSSYWRTYFDSSHSIKTNWYFKAK